MELFTFYWLDGTREMLIGKSVNDALNQAGYGHGALKALDFWKQGSDSSYVWTGSKWNKI